MGQGPSVTDLHNERASWADHKLVIDAEKNHEFGKVVDKMKDDASLCFVERKAFGISFLHYYISDGKYRVEFDGDNHQDSVIKVSRETAQEAGAISSSFQFSNECKKRAKRIVGGTSFSLMLRNSEHAIAFIKTGSWISVQTVDDGVLLAKFSQYATHHMKQSQNMLPVELQLPQFNPSREPLSQSRANLNVFTFKEQFSSAQSHENDFNIVVIGPTGVGKSGLINLISNQVVCESKASLRSVTKSLNFLSGVMYVGEKQYPGYLVDTIGLCDSNMTPADVHKVLKHAIKVNLAHVNMWIFVLPRRLGSAERESFLTMLKWLNYNKHGDNFLFLINTCGKLSDDEKNNLIGELYTEYRVFSTMNGKRGSRTVAFCVDTEHSEESKLFVMQVVKDHATLCLKKVYIKESCHHLK